MRQRLCLDCDGRGTGSRVRLQNGLWGYTPCPTCDSAGYVNRTGPYRLTDGTWSDGVDRTHRISDNYFGEQNPQRMSVFYEHGWTAMKGNWEFEEFHTYAEAIDYADRTARKLGK